jgi:hypothetical protein
MGAFSVRAPTLGFLGLDHPPSLYSQEEDLMKTDVAPGHKRWFIPDCYLPGDDATEGNFVSHESCCMLNAGLSDARCVLPLYFEEDQPVSGIEISVGSQRCRHVRFDRLEEIASLRVPRDVPYALGVDSDNPVVVQHSRLDSRLGSLAYMTVLGYAED